MIVLGFDPGTANTGWGVIEQEGSRLASLGHGCIVTSAKDPTHVRLRQIYDQARGLIKRFCPDVIVLAALFVNVNVKTALAVAITHTHHNSDGMRAARGSSGVRR